MNSPNMGLDGFTLEKINQMCYQPLEEDCPIQLCSLTKEEIGRIPLMRQVIYLLNALSEKEITLTKEGMLPARMIKKIYSLGGYTWNIDSFRVLTDDIVPGIQPLRAVLSDIWLTKNSFGKLSLTEKGKKLLSDHNELMRSILLHLFTSYNTGWHDRMEDLDIANEGRLYSLWLLHHYGQEWLPIEFYADEYFKVFPTLRKDTGTKFFKCEDIYSHRILFHFFSLIGVCASREIRDPKTRITTIEIIKTPILDMMFSFEEPATI